MRIASRSRASIVAASRNRIAHRRRTNASDRVRLLAARSARETELAAMIRESRTEVRDQRMEEDAAWPQASSKARGSRSADAD
jgi:hypothetical protein